MQPRMKASMTKATNREKTPAMTSPSPTADRAAGAAGGAQATTGWSVDAADGGGAAGGCPADHPTGAAETTPVRWVGASGGTGESEVRSPSVGSSGDAALGSAGSELPEVSPWPGPELVMPRLPDTRSPACQTQAR